MKKRKLSRHQASDLDLIVSSGLFDEAYYLEQNPDVRTTGMEPAHHYLLRGASEGRDPSPGFSTRGYSERYRDVRFSAWNPLVHYLRAGRDEGRLADPLGDDIRLIRDSGMFDDAYYRAQAGVAIADDVDALQHYVHEGAAQGLDPCEDFSTSAYLRLNPTVADSGVNPLAHFIRYGRAGGLDSLRGVPPRGDFRGMYAARYADATAWPVVRVQGVGPRVSVIVSGDPAAGEVEALLVLGILVANSLGASLRVVTRDERDLDGALLRQVEQRSSVAVLGDVELAHLPPRSAHPLLMGEREVALVSGWRDTVAALGSALLDEEVVRVVQDDERAAHLAADERLLAAEALALRHGSPTVVLGQALLDVLVADFPHLSADALVAEPAFPEVRRPERSERHTRTLLFIADPGDPRSLFWRGGEALCQALERNLVDPEEWDVVCVGADPDLVLARGVRPRVLTRDAWLAQRPAVDAAFVPRTGTPVPREAVSEAASGAAVLLTGAHVPDAHGLSANLLTCDLATESMVQGLGRLTALGTDDQLRRANRDADHVERDWAAATVAAVDSLCERLGERLGSGRRVH
jgi:hypothetical protein